MRSQSVLVATSLLVCMLAACKPPATDDYANRGELPEPPERPSTPLDSPDTEGAIWAASDRDMRLVYGKPGETPLMALACEQSEIGRTIRITRFAPADPEATALMALIGNGHLARLPIDAVWNGRVWLWEAEFAANATDLEVLTGPRSVEATIPGAGSVMLNSSQRPARLIERCRIPSRPPSPVGPLPN